MEWRLGKASNHLRILASRKERGKRKIIQAKPKGVWYFLLKSLGVEKERSREFREVLEDMNGKESWKQFSESWQRLILESGSENLSGLELGSGPGSMPCDEEKKITSILKSFKLVSWGMEVKDGSNKQRRGFYWFFLTAECFWFAIRYENPGTFFNCKLWQL